MSCRRLLRAVLLATLAFATAGGPSAGLVATVATVSFISAGCGPSNDQEIVGTEDQDLDKIQHDVEQGLEGKSDSPNNPIILGDITPDVPAMGQYRPERRYLAWTFDAQLNPPVEINASARRDAGSIAVLLLWRPNCNSAWRTVARGTRSLQQDLPSDGSYLIVVGPRNPNAAGSVETVLQLAEELFAAIGPSSCPPGPFDRPAVPAPLSPTPTAPVGTIPGSFHVTDRGSAIYTVPLQLPPGRAGMQPDLALSYDSSGSNGLLGMGFALDGLSAISRCPKDPAHDGQRRGIEFADWDRMCLDGSRLIRLPNGDYHTERETFTRIRAYPPYSGPTRPDGSSPTSGPEYFRAWTKDGRVLEFGKAPAEFGQDPRVRSLPIKDSNPRDNYTLSWPLRRVEDRSGNFYIVEYGSEPGPFGETLEQWPARIQYTGWTNRTPGGAAALAPDRTVTFRYCDAGAGKECQPTVRPDAFHGFAHGVHVQRTRLLQAIDISGPNPTPSGNPGPASLVSRYVLHYGTDSGSGASRLESLEHCVPDGTSIVCKPPTRFGWQDAKAGFSDVPLVMPTDPPNGVGFTYGASTGWVGTFNPATWDTYVTQPERDRQVLDFDGDGLSDFLFPRDGSWKVLHASGRGSYDRTIDTGIPTVWSVSPIDYDGDGRTDLLIHGKENRVSKAMVALSDGQGFARVGTWIDVWSANVAGEEYPPVAPLTHPPLVSDFDGDGRPDVLVCHPQSDFDAGDGLAGTWELFSAPIDGRFDPRRDKARSTRLVQYDPGVRERPPCYDRSGQALLSIDLDGDGKVEVLAAVGDGTYAGTNIARGDLQGPAIEGGRRRPWWTNLLDLNGDGLPDLVNIQTDPSGTGGHLSTFVNRGNGVFERAESVFPFAPNHLDSAIVLDYDGDGLSDLLVAGRGSGSEHRYFVYLSNGITLVQSAMAAPVALLGKYVTALDADGDGLADLVNFGLTAAGETGPVAFQVSLHAGAFQVPGVMTEIRNGLVSSLPASAHAPTVGITYVPLIDTTVHHAAAPGSCRYPTHCMHRGGSLVSTILTDNGGVGLTGVIERQFDYSAGKADMRGRGFLGFAQRHEWNTATLVDTYRTFYQGNGGDGPSAPWDPAKADNDYRLAGLLRSERTEAWLPDGTKHIEQFTHSGAVRVVQQFQLGGLPSPGTYLPFSETSTGSAEESNVEYRHATTTTALDAGPFGCVKSVRTDAGDGTVETEEVTQFENNEAEWLLCLPRRHQRTGASLSETQVQQFSLTYEPHTLLVKTSTRIAGTTRGAFREVTFGHDQYGNQTRMDVRAAATDCASDAGGACAETRSSAVSFDDAGLFPVSRVNAAGHLVEFRHHPSLGSLLVREDENGIATRWGYDGFGRLGRVLRPDNSSTLVTLGPSADPSSPGLEVEVDQAGGSDARTRYDSVGRVVRQSSAVLGGRSFITTEYNTRGWVDRVSRPTPEGMAAHFFTTFTYDNVGRARSITAPDNATTKIDYLTDRLDVVDVNGLVVLRTDASQHVTRLLKGRRGEVVAATTGHGAPRASTTSYEYGAFGALRSVSTRDDNGRSVATTLTADAYGRRLTLDDPDAGKSSYVWNGFDEVMGQTNPAKLGSRVVRDSLGRITRQFDQVQLEPPRRGVTEIETRWTWDTANFGIGRIAETTSAPQRGGTHRRLFQYDRLGRPIQVTTSVGGGGGILVVQNGYDEFSRAATVTYPASPGLGQFGVRNKYDARGNLTDVFRLLPDGKSGTRYWHANSVDPDGQLTDEEFANGAHTTRGYYPETGRARTISTAVSGRPLQDASYDYYPNGNLRTRTEDGSVEDFTYDELDRLTGTTTSGGEQGAASLSIAYDKLGNIKHKSDVGTYTYQAPRPGGGFRAHAVSAAGNGRYEYENSFGAQKSRLDPATGATQAVDYTAFGMPSKLEATPAEPGVQIEYDADGERLTRYSDDTRTTYAGSLYERTVTRKPGGNIVENHRYFVQAAGRVVAQVSRSSANAPIGRRPMESEETLFLHDDRLGSSRFLTGDNGIVAETRRYDAFGRRHGAAGSPRTDRGYTGHEDDPFGLVNMGGRVYDPVLARFLQADPHEPSAYGSQHENRYSYALNNPHRYVDPTGFDDEPVGNEGPEEGGGEASDPAETNADRALREMGAMPGVGMRVELPPVPQVYDNEVPGSRQVSDAQANQTGPSFTERVLTTKYRALQSAAEAGETPYFFDPAYNNNVSIVTAQRLTTRFGGMGDAMIGGLTFGLGPIVGLTGHNFRQWAGLDEQVAEGTVDYERGQVAGYAALILLGGVHGMVGAGRGAAGAGAGALQAKAQPVQAMASRPAPSLPEYAGGKTSGVLRTPAGDMPLISGYKGPSAAMPRGTPGMNGNIKSHVEAHAASIMRQGGLDEATLYINRVPCPGSTGCGAMLERMLPEGARLRVIGPSGYDKVFLGSPD